MNRAESIARLKARPAMSVLVIGGGINGISVYRELALNGVDVVLAEKSDFCSGASSALSRMVHGGLRYLENGEFKLVQESLLERDRLLKNAPHFVAPLPTTVPIFDTFSGLLNGAFRFLGLTRQPARRGAVVIKAGLTLYDLFTGGRRALPAHEFRSRNATLKRWPALNPAVTASATYYDAWVSQPERLGIEMLRDAAGDNAIALNHTEVAREGGGLVLRDRIDGTTVPIAPQLIINATGGWIDLTNAAIGASNTPMMGGTKGSHLIVANAELYRALDGHMVYYENEDGRICIVFPYLGNVLVGSTDIRVDDPDSVRCEDDERDYILASLAQVFPTIRIAHDEIVFRFAGVRPLPASSDSVTGRIPRDHFCQMVEGAIPTLCMIGGKWTTFRSFGALAADMALERLGLVRTADTEDLPIGGGRDFPADPSAWSATVAGDTGVAPARVAQLVERYGTGAKPVAAEIGGGADQPIPGTSYSRREIDHLIRTEQVETLADLLLRRTTIAITGALSMVAIDATLGQLAQLKGWDAARRAAARSECLAELADRHGLDEATLISRNPGTAEWPATKSA